ncbi:unnamed protein product, partial [Tetraodon nigroviridis]
KPVVGVNTDPERSQGHLCLPVRYTRAFPEALEKLARGEFRYVGLVLLRRRCHGNGRRGADRGCRRQVAVAAEDPPAPGGDGHQPHARGPARAAAEPGAAQPGPPHHHAAAPRPGGEVLGAPPPARQRPERDLHRGVAVLQVPVLQATSGPWGPRPEVPGAPTRTLSVRLSCLQGVLLRDLGGRRALGEAEELRTQYLHWNRIQGLVLQHQQAGGASGGGDPDHGTVPGRNPAPAGPQLHPGSDGALQRVPGLPSGRRPSALQREGAHRQQSLLQQPPERLRQQ